MTIKKALFTMGKILLGGLAFFAGMLFGGMLAGALGMAVPALPAGADATTLMQFQLLSGFLFSCTLAFIARGLNGGFVIRWLLLAFFSWIVFSFNTYLEAAIFTAYEAASAYTLLMQYFAVALSSALIAGLFPAAQQGMPVRTQVRVFVSQYGLAQWAVRLAGALAIFPIIYIFFGRLAEPFVRTYYEGQMAGLALPGWGDILPTLFLRSLLFLLASLPLIILWQESRRSLFITLGAALFMLVGGLYLLQSTWFPATMRIVHSLEILADSFIYSGVLSILFMKEPAGQEPAAGTQAPFIKQLG